MNGWDLHERIKMHYSFDVSAEIWQKIRERAAIARRNGETSFVYYIKPCYAFRFDLK